MSRYGQRDWEGAPARIYNKWVLRLCYQMKIHAMILPMPFPTQVVVMLIPIARTVTSAKTPMILRIIIRSCSNALRCMQR
jgi:hypothetical protein